MNNLPVSIIIPEYNPNKKLLDNLKKYLKKNAKHTQIIEIQGANGLANAYNNGIKK
jgi:hypothetical protein